MVSAILAFVAAAAGSTGALLWLPWPRAPSSGPRRSEAAASRAPVARLLRLLAPAGRILRSPGAPEDLRGRIEAAGRPAGLGVREVMAAKLAAALLGGAVGVPLAAVAPGRLGLVLVPAASVAGFLAPDLWLGRLAAERARRVRRELPALLDILRVTVEAGASPAAALRAVGERADGPLAREWVAVASEVALGVPLSRALDDLRVRLPQPEIAALVAAIQRATLHGAPLADTLAAQARAARFALARRIRDDAARAGPKIQLVVALLLVPSVLLLVAAALASALLDGSADAVPL
jgi:tight adherence protein C